MYMHINTYNFTRVLHSFKPSVVILYDADIKLTRQIEIFKATRREIPLKVYFLVYDSSVEEQMYLDSIKREKQAFQQLIQQKAHMVIPADREGRDTGNTLLQRGSGRGEENGKSNSTRKAGGATKQEETRPIVIVDMREFRSSLPSMIHKRGIDIIPLTIE
uniref:ERCC4 domain-containing protein n=1 Tax=Amphimedon queenslandica TaxID=400682 RepID=A0A1X7SE57_AMPQE